MKHPYWDALKNLVIITSLYRNLRSNTINFLLIRDLVFISNSITLALTKQILLQKKGKKGNKQQKPLTALFVKIVSL